ncbi:MAG: PDR/VanB family oxidoreductase [Stackebrandtia sp.]
MSVSAPVRPAAERSQRRAPAPRSARNLLIVYAAIASLMTQLPPLFPPSFPQLRTPAWYAVAAVAGGLALLVAARPHTRRRLLLSLGWLLSALTVLLGFVVGDLIAMFCSWLAVPALALLAGQVRVKARKALLAAHVVASGSWVGIAVVIVAMSVAAMTASEIETAKVAYELMAVFDMTLLPWANFAATLSGIALGLTTKWGLIRYYWVAAKLTISIAILIAAFAFLHSALESAAEQAAHLAETGGSVAQIDGAVDVVFWGFGVAMLNLVAAMLLSLYKPGGKTRRGRRLSAAGSPRQAQIPVTVAGTRIVADGTAALTLRGASDAALPPWTPGAHVDLVLPSGKERQYSLYGDPDDADAYRIAVLLEPGGRGGSAEIHRLRSGAKLAVRRPRTNFPVADAPAHLFVAGGIGIVPFLPMIRELDAAGAEWSLVYRGKSMSKMAFAGALAGQHPRRVALVPSDTHPRPDFDAVLSAAPDGVAVYCCGPDGMLRAVEAAMSASCPHGTLHVERFAASQRPDAADNAPFKAELRQSGALVDVAADQTLLSAIQRVDPTIDLSCEDGVCGSCRTRVIAGVPDHRDDVLQPYERDRVDVIYPCVSRASGKRIVLDV